MVSAKLLSACAVILWSLRPVWVWKLRKFKGPRRIGILGNLPDILKSPSMTVWRQNQNKKYHKIYKIWNGGHPTIVIADPELHRQFMASLTVRPPLDYFTCLRGEYHYVAHKTLLSLSPDNDGQKFRSVRKAFDVGFMAPASLANHTPNLEECAARLVARVALYAESGEPIDMVESVMDMALNLVALAAFGIDTQSIEPVDQAAKKPALQAKGSHKAAASGAPKDWLQKPPGSKEFGRGFTHIIRIIIKHLDISQSTPWKLPGVFLPQLYKLTTWLANVLPDKLLREDRQARRELHQAVRVLMAEWSRSQAAQAAGDAQGAESKVSGRSFMAKLMEIAEQEGLSELDIISQCYTVFVGGSDTTTAQTCSILWLLATHPEVQAKVHAELDEVLQGQLPTAENIQPANLPYLTAVMDEALRFRNPADQLLRYTTKKVDLGNGLVMPANVFVVLDHRACAMDPDIWPRAEEFLPERWLPGNEHLAPSKPVWQPFGFGSRMCPGYKFALLEMRLALTGLLQRFSVSMAPGMPEPEWKSAVTWTPQHMWMNFSKRPTTGSGGQ